LSFGNPKSDTCQTCDRPENFIKCNDQLNSDIKLFLIEEKQIHQKKNQNYFILILKDYLWNLRKMLI